MPVYLSPGVYVEEVPSAIKPIAGVSTSTAGFIGVVPSTPLTIPVASITDELLGAGNGTKKDFDLAKKPAMTTNGTFTVRVNGAPVAATNDGSKISITGAAPAIGEEVRVDYVQANAFTVTVALNEPKLITNFSEYTKLFGDFSTDTWQRNLTHAVYGFFNNGGSTCYVMRVAAFADITNNKALAKFEGIDDIAIVAAPGVTDANARGEIEIHCRVKTQDRFAIFDSPEVVEDNNNILNLALLKPETDNNVLPLNTDFAAFYFPWIRAFDPPTKILNPKGDGGIFVPPSGHLAGIYARTDTNRGVHKAPANEAVLGALGAKYRISKAQQDNLNPQGVNCIRELNGNIYVWGGRTVGGNANADLKYINVRRTLLFLRESIDEGLQWAVFEPNNEALWQKITRNVTAFLTNVWRSGALFGSTPQQAFYVKCDAELNPPEVRDNGMVITEIGVAIVRPAEFVIFRISQFTAPSK
jgi:phage tail sheath protein FI